jgi:hypothetical protein
MCITLAFAKASVNKARFHFSSAAALTKGEKLQRIEQLQMCLYSNG